MDTRELLARGHALQRQGQLEQAAALYKQVLERNPNQVNALQLMGQAAVESGRFELAEQLLSRAVSLKPDLAPAWRDLGRAAKALGDSTRARACFEKAIGELPDDAALHGDFAELLADTGEVDAAIAEYQSAVTLDPRNAGMLCGLAMSLRQAKRPEEALRICESAITLEPGSAPAHATLASVLRDLDRPEEAVAAFERSIGLDAAFIPAYAFKGAAELECGRPAAALATLEACLARDPVNRSALAFKAIALGELGREEERGALLDFDRLIARFEPGAPPGFSNVAEFNEALARHALNHPTLVFEPQGKATRAGSQTGNLLAGEKGPVGMLEGVIRGAVEDYFEALPEDSGHPYARVRLPAWDLVAWATVLEAQGHQQPHIHPGGWLSGVYYVQVPQHPAGAASQAGWIEFGKAPESFRCQRTQSTRHYEPKPGLMLLFPSYFYHSTVPYSDDATRISIAFDVVPRRA